jgi:hypothetical protein
MMKEYLLLQPTHVSVPVVEVLTVLMEVECFLTVLLLPFHKLIEIQAILPQFFLHFIQGFFIRIRSPERYVNTYWKEKTCLCIVNFMRNATDSTEATGRSSMDRLSRNFPAGSHITHCSATILYSTPVVCSEDCCLLVAC